MISFSALFNVFMLLMLFFFIFAILGQFMFGDVKTGRVIDEYKNFGVFDRSFLLLFSISTGEQWNLIMYDCWRTEPDCEKGQTCGSDFAAVFFISFILLITDVLLNLFILVIVQQFQKVHLDQDGPVQLFQRDYETILAVWINFTSKYQCKKLNCAKLCDFLKALPPPLGFSDLPDAQLFR